MKALLLIGGFAVMAATAPPVSAQAGSESAPGVNPKDNITKVELLYKFDRLDNGGGINSLTYKYDKALDANWGFNVEMPFIVFDAAGLEDAGLGDIQARVRYVKSVGQISYLAGAEVVAATASDDVLGLGKWMLNPVAGLVYAFSKTTFAFVGYKHFFSVAGDNDRLDVNDSQPRLILGYTDPAGWWLLSDTKYTKSWEGNELEFIDTEVELGQMVDRGTGMWIRAGTGLLDSPKEFSINLGIRNIF